MYFTHTCTFIVQACSHWVVRPRYVHLRRSSIGTVTIPPHIQEMPKHTMRIHEIPPRKAFFCENSNRIRQYKRLADFSSTSLTCEENCQGEFNKQVWDLQNQLDLGDFEFFFSSVQIRSSLSSSQVWTGHPKVDRTLWNPECWRSFRIIQSHSCHFEMGCNMNFRFIMDRQAEHRLRSHWPVSMLPDALDASSILFPNSPNFRDVKSIGSQKNVPMLRGVASSKKARGHGGRGKLGTSKRLKRQVVSFRCKWRSAKWPWLVFLPVCQNYGSRIGPEPFGDSFRASEDSHISSCCTVTPVTAIIPVVSLPPAFSFSSFQHWGAKYLNGAKKHPVATVWPLGDLFCLVTLFRQ